MEILCYLTVEEVFETKLSVISVVFFGAGVLELSRSRDCSEAY